MLLERILEAQDYAYCKITLKDSQSLVIANTCYNGILRVNALSMIYSVFTEHLAATGNSVAGREQATSPGPSP